MYEQQQKNLISPKAAELILSLRDGDVALLYLYLCCHPTNDRDKISRDLFLPKQRLSEACERLEMLGLLSSDALSPEAPVPAVTPPAPPVMPEQPDLPPYTAEDVIIRSSSDNAFSTLIGEAQLIMGRPLSTTDLIKLLGIYDHFNLPPEVMMELMNFVADLYRWKYGERRRPSARAFELEARNWVERGITDFDAAEAYIRKVRDRRSQEGAIKDALKIVDRDFTDTERRYVDQWLDMGFGADAMSLAYDRTVTNTRKFSPAYMNKILQSWHDKGLHSLQEIQAKDSAHSRKAPAAPAHPGSDPADVWGIVDII